MPSEEDSQQERQSTTTQESAVSLFDSVIVGTNQDSEPDYTENLIQ